MPSATLHPDQANLDLQSSWQRCTLEVYGGASNSSAGLRLVMTPVLTPTDCIRHVWMSMMQTCGMGLSGPSDLCATASAIVPLKAICQALMSSIKIVYSAILHGLANRTMRFGSSTKVLAKRVTVFHQSTGKACSVLQNLKVSRCCFDAPGRTALLHNFGQAEAGDSWRSRALFHDL